MQANEVIFEKRACAFYQHVVSHSRGLCAVTPQYDAEPPTLGLFPPFPGLLLSMGEEDFLLIVLKANYSSLGSQIN